MAFFVHLFRDTINDFRKENVAQMSAALAYFSLFAIAPILLITLSFLNFFLSDSQVQNPFLNEVEVVTGAEVTKTLSILIKNLRLNNQQNIFVEILGIFMLLVGATTIFIQLQHTLNLLWNIPTSHHSFKKKLDKRFLALIFVVLSGILLVALFFITIAINITGIFLIGDTIGLHVINFLISIVFITGIFATIFKFVPDADIAWRDAFFGAFMTSIMFLFGRYFIIFYLSNALIRSVYGTTGSLLVLLIWIYYSAFIFLFGAVFTKIFAHKFGSGIHPD